MNDTATITLDIDNLKAGAPLYCQYPGQHNLQPAYVEINEDGFVSADCSGEVGGGIPMHVWHNRTIRIPVPAEANGLELARVLREEALPLLEAIHAGHSIEWDGNNHVGRLDDDARAAAEKLEEMLADVPVMTVWSASEWLFSGDATLEHAWLRGETIDQAAHRNWQYSEGTEDWIDGSLQDALAREASRVVLRAIDDQNGSGLRPEWIDAALADGRISAEEADQARALLSN